LIVLRGNSGSGKSTVARAVRAAYGRGLAVVGQDTVRREILRERDVPGGANIGLIDTIVRYSLGAGFHVLLEGILTASRYAAMLEALHHDHAGPSAWYYLDVSLPETLRRHATRVQRHEFSAQDLQQWYREHDLLPRQREGDRRGQRPGRDRTASAARVRAAHHSTIPPIGSGHASVPPALRRHLRARRDGAVFHLLGTVVQESLVKGPAWPSHGNVLRI
jgi:hypothetical protein